MKSWLRERLVDYVPIHQASAELSGGLGDVVDDDLCQRGGVALGVHAACTFVLRQDGHTRLWPRTSIPFSRSQSTAASVAGRDAATDHCGHFISFSITAKLNSCTISCLYLARSSRAQTPAGKRSRR